MYSNGKILFDSAKTETVPFEGLISEGSCIRIEFSTDESKTAPGFNIRFEGKLNFICRLYVRNVVYLIRMLIFFTWNIFILP